MNRAPRTNAKTRTGETPKGEPPLPTTVPVEPPQDLPEHPSPGATTGIMPVVDAADPDKFSDDSAEGYV